MILHVGLLLLLVAPSGQSRSGQHASASGSLTISVIVTSSVSVTFAPDGTPTVIVANAPADAAAIALVSSPTVVKTRIKPSKPNPRKNKGIRHESTR
jgi:hypothetical protein